MLYTGKYPKQREARCQVSPPVRFYFLQLLTLSALPAAES